MGKLRAVLTDNSIFRRSYVICLFLCNITPLLVFMYVLLAALFLWGAFLLVYNEIVRRSAGKTRFGLWLVLFLVSGVITALLHLSANPLYNLHNLFMLLHVGICFFIYYGVHTEENLNFRRELYSICGFIVYTTTVIGIIGLACLMADIKFEIFGLKFIVFENRFTGLYANPNTVGFVAVAAILCCHMLLKKDFIAISGRERVSTIWIASSAAVNLISLLLSDSNGALVLMIGYAFFFLMYKMIGTERKFSIKQIVTKSISCLLAGVVIVASLFFIRNVMQEGFVKLMSATEPIVVIEGNLTNDEEGIITFEHENKNIDSGRFKLWQQAAEMFIHNPVMGIGKGNIYEYGKKMFVNGVKFSDKYGLLSPLMTDFHNGYFTVLVCSGTVGFILLMIFGIRFFLRLSGYVFREEGLRESTLPCMYAFLCAYMIYAFVEEALLFNISFVVVFFWLILGYASCFVVQFEQGRPVGHVKILNRKVRKTFL